MLDLHRLLAVETCIECIFKCAYYRTYSYEGDGFPWRVRHAPIVAERGGVIQRRLIDGRQQLRLRVLRRARVSQHSVKVGNKKKGTIVKFLLHDQQFP